MPGFQPVGNFQCSIQSIYTDDILERTVSHVASVLLNTRYTQGGAQAMLVEMQEPTVCTYWFTACTPLLCTVRDGYDAVIHPAFSIHS